MTPVRSPVVVTPSLQPEAVIVRTEPSIQDRLVRIALSDVGIQERGVNDGPEVRSFLASVGLPAGHPWCGAWLHDVFRRGGILLTPERSFALAATWSKQHVVFKRGQLDAFDESNISGLERISDNADAFTLHYANLKRVGHVGMVVGEDDDFFYTVEGNTGPGGEREGQGVYKRMRDKELVWTLNRWIPDELAEPTHLTAGDPGGGHSGLRIVPGRELSAPPYRAADQSPMEREQHRLPRAA